MSLNLKKQKSSFTPTTLVHLNAGEINLVGQVLKTGLFLFKDLFRQLFVYCSNNLAFVMFQKGVIFGCQVLQAFSVISLLFKIASTQKQSKFFFESNTLKQLAPLSHASISHEMKQPNPQPNSKKGGFNRTYSLALWQPIFYLLRQLWQQERLYSGCRSINSEV